jgi:Protein of unknown function (DUF4031)
MSYRQRRTAYGGTVAVYLDDWRQRATVGALTTRWSHLLGDSEDELHEFAARLGLRRRGYQVHRRHRALNHYDVPEALRPAALELGAVAVSWRQMGAMVRHWRRPGAPAQARRAVEGTMPASSSAPTSRATCSGSSRSQRPAEAM